jgi:chemotaxis protein MotA
MDFATLLGLLSGMALVVAAIVMGADVNIFIDVPSS